MDQADFLERLIDLLDDNHIEYCVIGGQAVNAYADPLVSLDLDLAVVTEHVDKVEQLMADRFQVKRFPHSLNVYLPGSELHVRIQTDLRYADFPERAVHRSILGLDLPVAALDDVLQGKLWAVQDSNRRPSKRQKDLADIARLLENYPELEQHVPEAILARLF
ncbi:MAG: nucleotidyl transferase AbiEii/AbiGii toxin family protein [Ardenticatenaceae bacterium]|nr:nucleotidyl transferase AbiEii/AbiGii toxin family protein [Ardenticatenaceae bacterium]